jgi:acyl dehydratase
MTDVKFGKPVFHGDTIHVSSEVVSKRESRSRPDAGILELHHRAYNQKNELVAECRRQIFVLKTPQKD